MKKRSFTLFEILISITLVLIIYSIAINKFDLNANKNEQINLQNMKKTLLNYEYEQNIAFKCTQDDGCFLFIDGVKQEQNFKSIFSQTPTVYTYEKDFKTIEFPRLELEDLESYDIVFDFTCYSDFECSEYILEVDSKGYIISNLQREIQVFAYFSDIKEYWQEMIDEVNDAI